MRILIVDDCKTYFVSDSMNFTLNGVTNLGNLLGSRLGDLLSRQEANLADGKTYELHLSATVVELPPEEQTSEEIVEGEAQEALEVE